MAEALLINRKDVVMFTTMNGNVDTDKFIQYIKIAQDVHIRNYLGTDLFNKIKADIIAGTLAGIYLTLVNDYLKNMLIHWAMVEYLPFAAYTVSNKGVYKHTSENSVNVEKNEVDSLVEKQRNIAKGYTKLFTDYMSYHGNLYPEYLSNTNEDKRPDKEVNMGGWFL